MLYALDLFSGIAGNSLGLADYVRTVTYCEADRHAQAVLLSRMSDGSIPRAPICTDVTRLDGYAFRGKVDIILAGFPCQDISVAGKGAGLGGERSGLFYEVVRLAKEIEPTFLFLENVPAIRTRGLDRVVEEFTALGYDMRWTMLSAGEVGAPHKRNRWFCLAAHPQRLKLWKQSGWSCRPSREETLFSGVDGKIQSLAHTNKQNDKPQPGSMGSAPSPSQQQVGRNGLDSVGSETPRSVLAHAASTRWDGQGTSKSGEEKSRWTFSRARGCDWWSVEPGVGRVAHGIPLRLDRIKRLGNAVVPAQAKEAFEILMGLKE